MWGEAKVVLKEKIIAFNAYIREKMEWANHQLKNLENRTVE